MLNDQTKMILSFRGFAELQRWKQEQRQALKDSSRKLQVGKHYHREVGPFSCSSRWGKAWGSG